MEFKLSTQEAIFIAIVVSMVSSIGILEFYGYRYTSAIEAMGGLLFSGLLVLLYYRQASILDNQEDLMQDQTRMMMEKHRPQLLFEFIKLKQEENIVSYNVKNVGPGTAFDIGFQIELGLRKEDVDNISTYCQVVRVSGDNSRSLGVLRSSEEVMMDFEVYLPNPNTKEQSLPISTALSKFDYSQYSDSRVLVKETYSDARGENWGGSIIDQGVFVLHDIEDLDDFWSYMDSQLDIEEDIWISDDELTEAVN